MIIVNLYFFVAVALLAYLDDKSCKKACEVYCEEQINESKNKETEPGCKDPEVR